jgi:hypothetical protein
MSKTPRPLNDVELAILRDFDRAPIKSQDEYSDGQGRVLLTSLDHYYQRPLGVLLSRGLVEFFKRCGCEGPCVCDANGWHITPPGRAERAKVGA